jgi:hypothetical protein
MGSRLACHFANIGLQTYLLDIVPFDLKEEEKTIPAARNRIVNAALDSTLKSNPSPIYDKALLLELKLETLMTIWNGLKTVIGYLKQL